MRRMVIQAVLMGTAALLVMAGYGKAEGATVPKPVSAAVAAGVEFQPFWAGFRKAVLAHDVAAIEAMTRFPLKAKGELDDDPAKPISKAGFPPVLAAILKGDANVRGFQGTTQDFVQSHPTFPVDKLDGGGHQRVGDLVFQRGAGGWALAMVYPPE
jgi:hypothetical protein